MLGQAELRLARLTAESSAAQLGDPQARANRAEQGLVEPEYQA